jgi:tetratricopeptide (TPR) repeat protein
VTIAPLVRKVLLRAAESSLDIAGSALLPGAWPILKGALEPVLERLEQRLDPDGKLSPKQRAERVADAFEADQHLQEIVRSALLPELQALTQGQQQVNADVQRLMAMVSVDQRSLQRIERRLDSGVELSDAAIAKLAAAVARQAEGQREVRAVALRAMGPVADVLVRVVQRLQVRAVELLEAGSSERALEELRDGRELVAVVLNEAPTDATARLELGFIDKTLAQVYAATGESAAAATAAHDAAEIFERIRVDGEGDARASWQVATAVHGLGNLAHDDGDLAEAVTRYRESLALFPGNPYALRDLFLAYDGLARQGRPQLREMRAVLRELQASPRADLQGLDDSHVAELEAKLQELDGA